LISVSFQSQQIHPREKPTPPLLSAAPDEAAANRKTKTISKGGLAAIGGAVATHAFVSS
jgi:hypothetical protein